MNSSDDGSDEVRELLREFVPEIADGRIRIKSIARKRGQRTIVSVGPKDRNVCPVGSCVGKHGSRIKEVVKRLGGEKVDVVAWSDSPETYLRNILAPARVDRIAFREAGPSVTVYSPAMCRALIVGRRGLRLELVKRLNGWTVSVVDV